MNILLNSSLQSLMELIGVLIIFVFVLILTYLTTRWLGNYQKGHTNNKNLGLIETISVGNNKTISILKAGKKYFVVSTGKDQVNLIGQLTEEDLVDLSFKDQTQTTGKDSFSQILSKFKGSIPKQQDQDEHN